MDIAVPGLNQCEKLNLLRIVYDAELSVSTIRLLSRFIDQPNSLLWSSRRLAQSIQRSVRTVERSIAELRELGIIETARRGIYTMSKTIRPERIVALGKAGAAASKKASAVAKSLLAKGKFFTRQVCQRISILEDKIADEDAVWRVQGAPTPSLLASLGLRTGKRRRER